MKETKEPKSKADVITGVSSAVGAAAGVVIGSAMASEVDAAEVTPEQVSTSESHVHIHVHSEPVHAPDIITEPEVVLDSDTDLRPDMDAIPESDSDSVLELDHNPVPEPEVEVLSYETVANEDGSMMDIAVVHADGQDVLFADIDQNGLADVMAADQNLNGQLDDGEVFDVSDEHILMQPLQDAADAGGGEDLLAQADDVDYFNDANVDDYIA